MVSVDASPMTPTSVKPPVEPPTTIPEKPAPSTPEPPKPEPPKPEPPKPEPPKPEPPKPEPPRADPQQLLQIAQALDAARYYLAQREMDSAKAQIDLAKKSDPTKAKAKEIARADMLRDLVRQFWDAVHKSVKSLQSAEELTLPGKNGPVTFVVVEIEPDGLTIKIGGTLETCHYKTMKSGLAYGLAERWLNKGDAVSLMVLGAFKAVNPTSQRQEARDLWEDAARRGQRDAAMLLMPELDIPIPKELPRRPKALAQPKAGKDGRFLPPAGETLKQANALADVQYKSRINTASSPEDKAGLAEQLNSHALAEQTDPNLRYVLLTRAAELYAGGGNYELAIGAIDALEQSHVVQGVNLKAELMERTARSAPDDPQVDQKLASAGLLVADEALLLGEFTDSLLAARAAYAAAVKAKDKELISQIKARMNEIIAARKDASGS